MSQRFPREHLAIKPQAAGFRHWLKVLGELNWRVLPGSKQAVKQALQDPTCSTQKLTTICLRDPLLCWLLSRRANTIIRERDKWPGGIEQCISLLGHKQVGKIAASADELSQLQLQDHGYCLSREIIDTGLARQLFFQLCQLLKLDWYQRYSFCCLFLRLPQIGLGIAKPDILWQLQVLLGHGQPAERAQNMLMGCQLSNFTIPYSQQVLISHGCRDVWRLVDSPEWQQACKQARSNAQRLAAGEKIAPTESPLLLILACHQLVAQQWLQEPEALELAAGFSALPAHFLHRQLSRARLQMPWHPALETSLHPARWQLCHWQLPQWLPRPGQARTPTQVTASDDPAAATPEDTMELFKERLARLHSPQAFASIATLLAFTKHSIELGLKPQAAMILICSQGQLKCRHSFGLRNYEAPLQLQQKDFIWPMQKLFHEAGSVQLAASEERLPKALRDCFSEHQFLGLQSIMVKTKPAALLVIAENEELNAQRMQLFTQFGEAFHKALLCQLGARSTATS